ncbi:hypothetical protein GY45DRAFT_4001 [Cubamyces sp. BRFM 1775]|nr:hypothetical protein GY45DRAFT_4001 [Cubamyces sp. BRFM 1775]
MWRQQADGQKRELPRAECESRARAGATEDGGRAGRRRRSGERATEMAKRSLGESTDPARSAILRTSRLPGSRGASWMCGALGCARARIARGGAARSTFRCLLCSVQGPLGHKRGDHQDRTGLRMYSIRRGSQSTMRTTQRVRVRVFVFVRERPAEGSRTVRMMCGSAWYLQEDSM